MADVKLTPSQQAIVDYRGGAMLVSAAAGSGKTMVLVQRLLGWICNAQDPKNVDDFLMITYTKKAAQELRGKIVEAIGKRLAEEPGNRHLRRQMQRVYSAQISTVHAFCAEILRTYANHLSLPQDFRIAEDAECAILRETVAEQLLDTRYLEINHDAQLKAAVDLFGAGRDDRALPQVILSLYETIRCHPDPEKLLQAYSAQLAFDPTEDLAQTVWGAALVRSVTLLAEQEAMEIAALLDEFDSAPEYEAAYGSSLRHTLEDLQRLAACNSWDGIIAAKEVAFDRLKPLKKGTDPTLKETVSAVRDGCKDRLKKQLAPFCADSAAMVQDQLSVRPALEGLYALVRQFDQNYTAAKQRRNILDFGDLEHHALTLLYGRGLTGPTVAAREISARYAEVMVDEYQDTNAVQDQIFTAVSTGGTHLFMVGDVKQSIYRFRMADPGIFLKKYRTFQDYTPGVTGAARFFLSENFRSQPAVLDAANHVFSTVMSETVGDLNYTERERLRPGTVHPVIPEPCVELHCLQTAADEAEDSPDKNQAEAAYLAERIHSMLERGEQISAGDGTRAVEPGDIVILLRTMTSAAVYVQALLAAGIPAGSEQPQSIWETSEVSVLISLMQIVDNPYQDIPLLSVLPSPLFGFSPDELAQIRLQDRTAALFDALQTVPTPHAQQFLAVLQELRTAASAMPLGALTEFFLHRTEMLERYAAMENGLQRSEHLRQFADYVRSCEKVTPTLSTFLRQLEKQMESGKPIGAAVSETSNRVTVLSVHKSKGLEFPVVFLADLSRRFNEEDLRQMLLMHQTFGVGAMACDSAHQIRFPTVSRYAASVGLAADNRSEELRVLYVAMTRAKDRLIMTYCSRYLLRELKKQAATLTYPVTPLQASGVRAPGQWILQAALCRAEAEALFAVTGRPACVRNFGDSPWKIVLTDAVPQETSKSVAITAENIVLPAPPVEQVRQLLQFTYPYEAETKTPAKVTPTQLKGRLKDLESAEEAAQAGTFLQVQLRKPNFVTHQRLAAAERGTAMHLALQYLDFNRCLTEERTRIEIETLVQENHLRPEQADAINPAQITAFVCTPLGQRLLHAERCLREFKFSVLADSDALPEFDGAGQVLLQGVVDCCFEEPEGLVIIDFKTDRVSEVQVLERSERYKTQLACYAYAMEQVLQQPVKACYLYFLSTGNTVQMQ